MYRKVDKGGHEPSVDCEVDTQAVDADQKDAAPSRGKRREMK